jgi:hypothetical protein
MGGIIISNSFQELKLQHHKLLEQNEAFYEQTHKVQEQLTYMTEREKV